MKMKHRSHRYDINRPKSRHGQKYSKYKKCLWKYQLTGFYMMGTFAVKRLNVLSNT